MKTLVTSALIALIFCTASVSFAGGPTPFRSVIQPRTNGLKVDVVVEKDLNARLLVALHDADGHTLATQALGKGDTVSRTRFDVAALPDGRYTVVVTDGSYVETNEVTLLTPIRTLAAN
ncbi:MAG: hypothetical protein H7Z72_11485 [Bacteroidetes bacterium]|nr:hypothetical protein [Fibrella sp.]